MEVDLLTVTSHHGASEKSEVEGRRPEVHEWCERVTLPIEKAGVTIRIWE